MKEKKQLRFEMIHAECIQYMESLPDKSIDLVLTDPPYGITANKWDSLLPLSELWLQLKRIIKPRCGIILFGNQPFTSTLITSNLDWFKYVIAWDKVRPSCALVAKHRPMNQIEDIIVFGKAAIHYYPVMTLCKRRIEKPRVKNHGSNYNQTPKKPIACDNKGLKYPTTLLRFGRDPIANKESHPTQKPVALLEYLIKQYSKEGDTILDFTAGNFSTGVACKNMYRAFIGIELSKEYFEMGKRRLAAWEIASKFNYLRVKNQERKETK